MANFTPEQLEGAQVQSTDGDKIGKVEAVYFDDRTDKPEWIAVKTGMFGSNVSFVPLASAEYAPDTDDALRVPFDKGFVKDSPNHDLDRHLSPEDEAELYRYYGITYDAEPAVRTAPAGTAVVEERPVAERPVATERPVAAEPVAGRPVAERPAPKRDTDDAMTRSEERLHVSKEKGEIGKARLRKHVVTENVTKTVPVTHEEVVVEREPITAANADKAKSGPAFKEDEQEVTLHGERAKVEKEEVPVERVKLGTEKRTDEKTVSGKVRREEIEAEGVDTYPEDKRAARETERRR